MTRSDADYIPAGVQESQLHSVGCGYNLTGVTIGSVCPECGRAIEETLNAAQSPKTNSAAISSLVLGILSLTVCGVLGPLAIVSYLRARKQMAVGIYSHGSRGMAIGGLVMGIIATLGSIGIVAIMLLGAYW